MKILNVSIPTESISKIKKNLSLAEGKIIKAQVIKAHGNNLVLRIGNTTLNALTEVNLNKGDNLQLLVESMKDDVIKLKILPEGEVVGKETILLSRMGIKPERGSESVVRELVRFKMPITLESISEINNFMRLNDLPKDVLPILLWLKSSGVKVLSKDDAEQLVNLNRFFKGELSENENEKFFKFINKTESIILGGYNIYAWPLREHQVYLLTDNSKKEKPEARNSTLVIKVVSQNFGDLWFKIRYSSQGLNVGVQCKEEKWKKMLAGEIGHLKENLKLSGYQINEMDVYIGHKSTIMDFVPINSKSATGVNYEV